MKQVIEFVIVLPFITAGATAGLVLCKTGSFVLSLKVFGCMFVAGVLLACMTIYVLGSLWRSFQEAHEVDRMLSKRR